MQKKKKKSMILNLNIRKSFLFFLSINEIINSFRYIDTPENNRTLIRVVYGLQDV